MSKFLEGDRVRITRDGGLNQVHLIDYVIETTVIKTNAGSLVAYDPGLTPDAMTYIDWYEGTREYTVELLSHAPMPPLPTKRGAVVKFEGWLPIVLIKSHAYGTDGHWVSTMHGKPVDYIQQSQQENMPFEVLFEGFE